MEKNFYERVLLEELSDYHYLCFPGPLMWVLIILIVFFILLALFCYRRVRKRYVFYFIFSTALETHSPIKRMPSRLER